MKSSMKLTKKEIFSIPNILCYFRILLIPVFMISYINAKETRDYYFAAFIVLLSGLTDFADGFIARHFNMVTELGKAIDPVADKLSQAAIVISLMIRIEPMRWLFLLFAVKELFMGITSIVLLTKHNTKMDGAQMVRQSFHLCVLHCHVHYYRFSKLGCRCSKHFNSNLRPFPSSGLPALRPGVS